MPWEYQEALRMGHLSPMSRQRDVYVVRDSILVGVSADQWRLHCDYKGGGVVRYYVMVRGNKNLSWN